MFLRGSKTLNNVTIILSSESGLQDMHFVPNTDPLSVSAYMELEPGSYVHIQTAAKSIIVVQNLVQ